jgi:stage IV sporulation protein FB
MFERGYLTLGRWHTAPIRIHWSTPLGALVFGGLSFSPVFWGAFFVLVLVHELGHALLARSYGARVLSIDVTGFGGLCRWSGTVSDYQRAKIAWGGVLAQALLLAVAVALLVFALPAQGLIVAQLEAAFVSTNLLLIGLNLLPFRPLDGAEAWSIVTDLAARWRGRRLLRSIGLPGREQARRPRRRVGRAASERGNRGPTGQPQAETSRPSGKPPAELAELLRQIGDEAGRARRGQPPQDKR